MKRILALVLALLMAVCACSVALSEAPIASEEPITLTWMPNAWGDNPTGLMTQPVLEELARRTGVKIEVYNIGAAGDTESKLAALMSTGDLPDLVSSPAAQLMAAGVQSGQFIALDELLAEHTPEFYEQFKTAFEYIKTGTGDGKIHYVPKDVGVYFFDKTYPVCVPFVRWDLYEQLGCPEINTLEDLIPLMQQMLELEPVNADGQKNYGIAPGLGGGAWDGDWNIWAGPAAMYGVNTNNYSSMNEVQDRTIRPLMTDVDSITHRIIRFWYECNKAGLLDPDAFTMKQENVAEKAKAGRFMMSFANWDMLNINAGFEARGIADKGMSPIPLPKDAIGNWVSTNQPTGTPLSGTAITNNCKYPEAAVKFLAYINTYEGAELVLNGIEGQHWDMDGGRPYRKPGIDVSIAIDTEDSKREGLMLLKGMLSIGMGEADPRYEDTYVVFERKDVDVPPIVQKMMDHYGFTTPMDIITKNENLKSYIMDWPEWPYVPLPDEDTQRLFDQVDNYIFTNFTTMIAATDDEDFEAQRDAFIEGLKDVGYDDAQAWYLARIEEAKAKMG